MFGVFLDETSSDFIESFYIGKGLEMCLRNIVYQKTKMENRQRISKLQILAPDFEENDEKAIEPSNKIEWKILKRDSSNQIFCTNSNLSWLECLSCFSGKCSDQKLSPLSCQGERISVQVLQTNIENSPKFLACSDPSKIKFSEKESEVGSKRILTPSTNSDEKEQNGSRIK